ncbi:MAG TPA: hypothetical protein VEZ71_14190 [Archangium sp.]|nr:hypothetical protein [Archangium sp.]
MSPMPSLLRLALLSVLCVVSACTLRPYYRQVLPPDMAGMKPQAAEGQGPVTLRMVEPGTDKPIAGARVILSLMNRGRVVATSDANGLIQLPVTPELLAENPLVEVVLPPGLRGYSFLTVPAQPASQPAGEAAPRQPQE